MPKKDDKDFSIKPSGSYLDSLADFADLLGSIKDAEIAANELSATSNAAINANTEKTDAQGEAPPDLDTLMAELDSLIGLDRIKTNVKSLINLVKVRKMREDNDLPVPPLSLHLVFMGNPGTGKTTVARLIAQLYHAIGVLSKGQLVEVDRSGLVAGFVGQTALKTSEIIQKAIGGVLFIDEAYSLTSKNGSNDFGSEAIETLLKAMEDNRRDLVVIVAGYEQLMEEFISSNPGLESRFNRYFVFEDYTGDELNKIFCSMCEKNGYILNEESNKCAGELFLHLYNTRDENFGNARDVRNIFENIIVTQSNRLAEIESPSKDDLMTFTKEDITSSAEL